MAEVVAQVVVCVTVHRHHVLGLCFAFIVGGFVILDNDVVNVNGGGWRGVVVGVVEGAVVGRLVRGRHFET